jgi:molybdopterin-guanine dinucleotide biosynthesis protein A
VAAFILAGGASSRMRTDKALLRIAGVTLLARTAQLLRPLVHKVTCIGTPRLCGGARLPTISDQPIPGAEAKGSPSGPLAGIGTALMHTQSAWNVIVACDLPYLSEAWLEWLLARAVRSRSQAVVPRSANGLEPLAAVYRRECASAIAAALARGVRKVTTAIDELRPEIVEESAWRHLDRQGMVLKNMNTPEDYVEARRRASRVWGAR